MTRLFLTTTNKTLLFSPKKNSYNPSQFSLTRFSKKNFSLTQKSCDPIGNKFYNKKIKNWTPF